MGDWARVSSVLLNLHPMPSAKLHFYHCCHDIQWCPPPQVFSFLFDLCHLISVLSFQKETSLPALSFFCWVIPPVSDKDSFREQVFNFCHAKRPLAKVLLPCSTEAFWYLCKFLCKTLPRVTLALCTLITLLAQSADCVSSTFWCGWGLSLLAYSQMW